MWSSGKRTFFFLVCENGLDIVGIITTPVSFSRVTARHLTSNMHQLDRVDFTVHWCVENSWPIAISVHANKTWYFNWKEGENTDVRSRLRPWQWCSSLQKDGWWYFECFGGSLRFVIALSKLLFHSKSITFQNACNFCCKSRTQCVTTHESGVNIHY